MECSICCEKFNKSSLCKVECKGCNDDSNACRKCCQTYILNGSQNPSCMFCKSEWDRDFLNTNLTKKFVENDLKIFSENLFVERQIALLPDTQKDAAKEKKIKEVNAHCSEAKSELNRLLKQVHDQKEIINSYLLEISRLKSGTSTSTLENNFTIKCNTSNCHGFLNSKYFCTLCETKFCKSCMEVKGEDHVCDEDTKASVQAIKKEAKPCPGCGEMISKIDGCDQMWCITCHIQFSWRTGAQITGYNHNPEYFRWMRETGKHIDVAPNAQDRRNVCGVPISDAVINGILSPIFSRYEKPYIIILDLYRFYIHLQYRARDAEDNPEPILKNLRIKYLLGDISKEEWKKNLQQIDKKTKKNNAYNNLWQLSNTVITNFMERIIHIHTDLENKLPMKEEYINLCARAEEFRVYINESFISTSNIFKSNACPGLDTNWREIFNYKTHLKKIEANKNARDAVHNTTMLTFPVVNGMPRLGGGFT